MKRITVPITRVDEAAREIYGAMTSAAVDKMGEVCDYPTSKPYFQAWSDEIASATGGKSVGNVRVMHKPIVAGGLKAIAYDDAGEVIEVVAKVGDHADGEDAWKQVLAGHLTGFSLGGNYVSRWQDPKDKNVYRYTVRPVEISLVDNPANPDCHFTLVRADGSQAQIAAVGSGEPRQVWTCTKGVQHEHLTKSEAAGCGGGLDWSAVEKCVYCVAELASVIAQASWVEAMLGMEDSTTAPAMHFEVDALYELLMQVAEEDRAKHMDNGESMMAAVTAVLEKTLASLASEDALRKFVQEAIVMKTPVAQPAEPAPEPAVEKSVLSGEIAKAIDALKVEVLAEVAELRKAVEARDEELEELATLVTEQGQKLQEFGALPAAPKAALRAVPVGKEADVIATDEPKKTEESVTDLVKSSLGKPISHREWNSGQR